MSDMISHTIKTINGRTLARTHDLTERWLWILDVVSENAECHPDDVNIVEAEDGDIITVKGKHYARITISSHEP
jgi:hypothetical protein